MKARHSSRINRLAHWAEHVLSLLLIIAVVGFMGSIVYAVYTLVAPEPPHLTHRIQIEIDPMTHAFSDDEGSSIPVELSHVEAQLALPYENRALRVWDTALSLISIFIGSLIVFQLRQFLRSFRTAHPFIRANAKRLRSIAWLFLIGSVWQFVAKFILASRASADFPHLDFNLTLRLDPSPVLILMVILIIAEAFNLGVKLKEEQDLTV